MVTVLLLAGEALRSRPQPDGGLRRMSRCVTVTALVRVRILLRDARNRPVAGARVMVAPTKDVMRTEEDVESIRRAIEFRLAQGERAWTCAIGKTGQDGAVELEFTRLTESDDPLFDDEQDSARKPFVFGAYVRVDARSCGTVLQELGDGRSIHYRRITTPTGRLPVAEAEFVVHCNE